MAELKRERPHAWDSTWEGVFRAREWGRYPPEELVRFIGGNYFSAPDRGRVRFLEIGSGAGANVWFLAREGFDVHGIDGSPSAIQQATARMRQERCTATLAVADAIDVAETYPAEYFDAIIDIACLQCHDVPTMRRIVENARGLLKPAGRFFSMLLAAGSFGDGIGAQIDRGTYSSVKTGPLKGLGTSHFSTLRDAKTLFSRFSSCEIEYSERSVDNRSARYRHWVIQAVR